MVTAELALTFPAIVLVLGICLSSISWGIDQVRCVDAARVAVRELARGEAADRAIGHAQRTAPDGATVDVRRDGDDVTVALRAAPPPMLSWVGRDTTCSATARVELLDATP